MYSSRNSAGSFATLAAIRRASEKSLQQTSEGPELQLRPLQFEELAEDSAISLVNEPRVAAVPLRPVQSERPIHAIIAENLAAVEALLARLESGVRAPDNQRPAIRDLYVQARRQREILSAALRLELDDTSLRR